MGNETTPARIVTVGTGCARPSLARGSSCLLIQAAGLNLCVDLGLGALHGLLRAGVAHGEVDALFFTHFHTDHTADLGAFLFAANYDETTRARPLAIFGGGGLEKYMEAMEALHGRWVAAKHYERTVREARPGDVFTLGGLTALAGPASHDESSLSWRFKADGRSLAVTGDTGPNPELTAFVKGADILISECSLPPDSPAPYHLRAEDAGVLAAEAGAGMLVLTHFYPSSEAFDPAGRAALHYGGPVAAANDGDEFAFPSPPKMT